MKKSVGLIVVTESENTGFKIALQRRGSQDTFPGACQVTVHGKLENQEHFLQALERECREELGAEFTEKLLQSWELLTIYHHTDDEKEVVTFAVLMPESMLDLIRLERTSGGIDHVSANLFFTGSITKISYDKKLEGYPPRVWAMYADEIEAVRQALKKFLE